MNRRVLLFSFPGLLLGNPCSSATWRTVLAPRGEPGSRMVVTGRVFRPDGQTPVAGVTIYAYQTDAKGEYGDGPRLRGWMVTDPQGRFQFESIRPGHYPNSRINAHVHFQLWGAGVPVQYAPDLLFDDDPHLRPQDRDRSRAAGQFGSIRVGATRGGVLHFTHDIRVKTSADQLEESVLHGYRACH